MARKHSRKVALSSSSENHRKNKNSSSRSNPRNSNPPQSSSHRSLIINSINDSNNDAHSSSSFSHNNSSATSIPSIPGFYYDEEKKKFFKVQNHPSQQHLGHSREAIRQKKLLQQSEKEIEKQWALKNESPRPKNIWSLLESRSKFPLFQPNQFMEDVICSMMNKAVMKEVRFEPCPVPSRFYRDDVTQFWVHPHKNDMYVGNLRGQVDFSRFSVKDNRYQQENQNLVAFALHSSQVTSIIPGIQNTLIVTWLGDRDCAGSVQVLPEREVDLSQQQIPDMTIPLFQDHFSRSSVWTALSFGHSIAIGKTKECIIIEDWTTESSARSSNLQPRFNSSLNDMNPFSPASFHSGIRPPLRKKLITNSDVFAIEKWDSEHSLPIILTGSRDGLVSIWDLRTSRREGRITHKGSICCMKRVKDFEIIVSAMRNQLCSWDLRMISGIPSNPKKCSSREPIVEYSGHINNYRLLQFAVDDSETILLSGGQDKMVRMWDIRSGHLLPSAPLGPFDDVVTCAQWVGNSVEPDPLPDDLDEMNLDNLEFRHQGPFQGVPLIKSSAANKFEVSQRLPGFWVTYGNRLEALQFP